MNTNPLLAAQVQTLAANERNDKLAFAMGTMTVAFLGLMFFKELSHCMQERLRGHDRDWERSR